MLLELFDLAAKQIIVVTDLFALAQAIEQRGVFARRDADAITGSVNHAFRLDRTTGQDRCVR